MSERIRSMQIGVDKVLALEARVAELEADIQLITAPAESTGGVFLALKSRVSELEAENAKLRRYYEIAEEIRVTINNALAFRIDDLDAARTEVDK